MDDYRNAVVRALKTESTSSKKFDGRELLKLIIKKWGVAYDIQLRKNSPFGEASANIYINVMWRYFGQKSFPMSEREYMEHLEAIARYINAVNKVDDFKDKVSESRKRPNAYFGYAVGLPLDVDPNTADKFFKDLPYEQTVSQSFGILGRLFNSSTAADKRQIERKTLKYHVCLSE